MILESHEQEFKDLFNSIDEVDDCINEFGKDICVNLYKKYYDDAISFIDETDNKKIYRGIHSSLSLKEIIQKSKQQGIGKFWSLEKDIVKDHAVGISNNDNVYIITGKKPNEIDQYDTIYANMQFDTQYKEIRLENNDSSKIFVEKICKINIPKKCEYINRDMKVWIPLHKS